jgi:hypothetical protein
MDAQGQALDITDLYQEWKGDGTLDDMVPWGYQKWDYNFCARRAQNGHV